MMSEVTFFDLGRVLGPAQLRGNTEAARTKAAVNSMGDGLPVGPRTTHSDLKKLAKKDWRFTKVMVNFLPCQVGLVQGENNKDL